MRRILVVSILLAAIAGAGTGGAAAAPVIGFERACLVEGGIRLTATSTEDVAAGRLEWLLSDGTVEPVPAVTADTPFATTTSQGGTSALRLDGQEAARTFTELEHIGDCERPAVVRLAGASRIETAVAISQQRFPNAAQAVYLASAGVFADALAGAPMAFDGPVLLVPRDTLPAAVRDEIARLQPSYLVVLGGTGAIAQTVEDEARAAAGL